ncbi:MAG: hypothetical protein ABL921_08110 [Pirellula sp.]
MTNQRMSFLVCLFSTALISANGCNPPAAQPPAPMKSTIASNASVENVIELSEPIVRFEAPDLIRFDFKYEFTEGSPNKFYLCEIVFPGTDHHGKKYMEKWELEKKGMIKSAIQLPELVPMVSNFEIKMSEANQPDAGFKKISNVVSGQVVIPAGGE